MVLYRLGDDLPSIHARVKRRKGVLEDDLERGPHLSELFPAQLEQVLPIKVHLP